MPPKKQKLKQVNLLSWNVENFSAKKKSSDLFYEYVTSVTLRLADAHFVGLIELQSFNAEEIGNQFGGRLYNDSMDWRFQDSDQFPQHSEQYLLVWRQDVFANAKLVYTFPGVEFPTSANRPPHLLIADAAGVTGAPFLIYHANKPKDPNCAKGNAALAKIPELAAATGGVVMGDFNVTPSDPTVSPGKDAFEDLIKLSYLMQLKSTKTSLKEIKSVAATASFGDCLASEYDNFFVKMPNTVTAKAELLDLFSPAVQGNGSFDTDYAEAFGNWVGERESPGSKTTKKFNSIYEAFCDYQKHISDHLPIRLALSF
jgi:hypothetical protein